MMPALKPNDRVIVSSLPYLFLKPKIGDVVVFRYNGEVLVKRIVRIENGKFSLEGDNKSDSLKTEPIERKDILGKVMFKTLNT